MVARSPLTNANNAVSRAPDQNGVSLLYIILEIHPSGRELSKYKVRRSKSETAPMPKCLSQQS